MRARFFSIFMFASGLVACGPNLGEQVSELGADAGSGHLTDEVCDELGDPWPGSSPAPTPTSCKGPWSKNWKPGRPICLGFRSDLENCSNCNWLDITTWTPAKNELYLACAEAGLLPGQTKDTKVCFVTDAGALTPPTEWPPYDAKPGQWTAREMCTLGVPEPGDVETCRSDGRCTDGSGTGSNGDGSGS